MWYNSFVYRMSCLYFVSVPRDCPTGHKIPQNPAIFESRVPGLGLNIRGTAGTGTDISGTVPRSLCPGTENSRDSRDCPMPIPGFTFTIVDIQIKLLHSTLQQKFFFGISKKRTFLRSDLRSTIKIFS